jgi:predicted SAM-dependent methyltransferase
MLKLKNFVKRVLPSQLRELCVFYLAQQKKSRKILQIEEKNRKKINSLLSSTLPIKLEFGAEKNRGLDGWTYVDVNGDCDLTLDLTHSLPFPNDSVGIIYSSHTLEHFEYFELLKLLTESLRVLKRGGIFSASVPNAQLYLNAYHNSENFDPEIFCRYKPAYDYNSKIDYVNYIAYMTGQHKYMFDEENIILILRKIGFKEVALRKIDPILDSKDRDYESIYIEAQK